MSFTVKQLLAATRGRLISGFPGQTIGPLSIDTRTLRSGDVFVALQGPRYDGHHFLKAAADRGASLLIVQAFDARADFQSNRLPDVVLVDDTLRALQDWGHFVRCQSLATVIGITGSNGKTTTKEMVSSIIRRVGKTLATRGNLNNHIGLPLMLAELERDHRFAVIEMGTSKKGDMALLSRLAKPSVGLITNVGKDHLEFLETPEGVLQENRLLYDDLPSDGTVILNVDDPLLAPLVKAWPGRRVITYGIHSDAFVRAEEIVASPESLCFTLRVGSEAYPVTLSAAGKVQALNATAAAATALGVGIPIPDIVAGLAAFRAPAMRLQVIERSDGSLLINDAYNANPSSMRASIESFCETYPNRPRWVVLGDMRELGTIARQEHEELGRWLGEQSLERILLYGRDIRFVESALRQQGKHPRVERYRKKRYLIEELQRSLPASHPAVLFKASRSLRLEQVVTPLKH